MAYVTAFSLFSLLISSCAARIPVSIDGPKFLNQSIVIIGGGINAVHMASLLKAKGFTDVTILTEDNRLGGSDVESRTHRSKKSYLFITRFFS